MIIEHQWLRAQGGLELGRAGASACESLEIHHRSMPAICVQICTIQSPCKANEDAVATLLTNVPLSPVPPV